MLKLKKENNDGQNYILFVPEITHDDWEIINNRVLLNVKVTNPITRLAGFLSKREPIRDILFDEKCTSAWIKIDGERSIYEIARLDSQCTDDEFYDNLRRLIEFIKYISKRGWIRYKKVKKIEEIKIYDNRV
ncbi:hypothetical protein [Tissierella sp. Yu-01]|uniref:hypothetical protein n=1 Tax=Tissierella sp. Yu-01 TaxID=3035694 RepID=UPI00240D763D|nr:hypothetical protein [Tissierella sp. Yu-01]WFA09978.1 hypothetical protein P3962_05345 [Tissierella sp. Yu-01]